MTDEQFIYKTRKKGFGEFKSDLWNLPDNVKSEIGVQLEGKLDFLFDKLNIKNTNEAVKKSVNVEKNLNRGH